MECSRMTIKIKDIAKALDISPSTVSLVLNNKPGVGPETREKVMNYIAENGYSVSTSKKYAMNNQNIGFIVYKKHGKVVSDTPFFSQVIEGIESESRKNGYNLTITYIDKTEETGQLLKYLSQNPPEGIILLATEMEKQNLAEFESIPVPIVLLDNCFDGLHLDMISIDNEEGAYEATQYLIEMGHKNIGYLHSSVLINNFTRRQSGFLDALRDNGLTVDPKNIFNVDSTIDGCYVDMRRQLEAGAKLPTALFADNDIIALGAIKALKEFKIRIPEDVSVIGFDDMPFCDLSDPALSTVKVFKQSMGKLAVDRLVEKIDNNTGDYIKTEVGTQLMKRNSVCART